MPSPHRSRSPSPYTKRASRSYRDERPRSPSPRRKSSRSPSPHPRHHHRSRSPRRHHDDRPKKSGGGGFRWKEKPRHEADERGDDRRLERGYREQERPRREPPGRDGGSRDERGRDDVEAKFGRQRSPIGKDAKRGDVKDDIGTGEKSTSEKEKREKKPIVAPVGQEMIIVKVNDRLGTAAQIPCLASDPISKCPSISQTS